jgi:hypothetical protein
MDKPVSVWRQYGYASTPYSTSAIAVADASAKLLVGRDQELESLLLRLTSGASLIAIEGDYGVGKSSLAAAAAAVASDWPVHQGESWFLAAPSPLEFFADDTVDAFEMRSYYQVAGSIIANAKKLQSDGYKLLDIAAFSAWLQSPEGRSWNAGIGLSAATIGSVTVSAGKARSSNSSKGFSDAGAISLIDRWLAELFPDSDRGGIILRLDNLESLARSSSLVALFEALRDRLFKRPGLRWIISGAEGMVRVALSTPKMTGTFSDPIDLSPLPPSSVPEVIRRRGVHLRARNNAVLPVDPITFEEVYLHTGQNLRFTLGLADRYSMASDPARVLWMSESERAGAFLAYVRREGERVVAQLDKRMTAATWRVLSALVVKMAGFASPSQHPRFGYANMAPLLSQVAKLSELGLIDYMVDEDDGRRRRIIATNQGRLAVAMRDGWSIPDLSEESGA